MSSNVKLSIAVITMNRANQLKEAIGSCFACNLPENTEFVIIDNASTDNTEDVVNELFSSSKYRHYYEKMPENLGVGGGRNYAFAKSSGEYVYVLDDDAYIDTNDQADFFEKAISILDNDEKIITLTTQIYDLLWKCDRLTAKNLPKYRNMYLTKMFCGGSHFLRSSFFAEAPYLPNKYGYEEIPPSVYVIDSGNCNVFVPELRVIHNPLVDKWDPSKKVNETILIKSVALPYAIKKMMYPASFKPILWLAYKARCFKFLKTDLRLHKLSHNMVSEFCEQYFISKKVRFATVVKMIKDFGLSAF